MPKNDILFLIAKLMKIIPNLCTWGPSRVILNLSLKEMLKNPKYSQIDMFAIHLRSILGSIELFSLGNYILHLMSFLMTYYAPKSNKQ